MTSVAHPSVSAMGGPIHVCVVDEVSEPKIAPNFFQNPKVQTILVRTQP